jgi:hypothetical protein
MHVLVEEHPKLAIEPGNVEECIVEVLRLVLKFFEDGYHQLVRHMVAVDEPPLSTIVQRDEANRALRVKNGIPLDSPVGLYIQSHLRG